MKRILVLIFALALTLGAAQAQKSNTTKSRNVNIAQQTTPVAPAAQAEETIDLPSDFLAMDMPLHEVLKLRATHREFSPDELPNELISSLLWAAYGINRKEADRRVVPSAVNMQEFDIYLLNERGAYLYDAHKNTLTLINAGDHRSQISTQKHFAVAPISLVLVANYDRMGRMKEQTDRDFYAAVDCGYISQNIYLFCASAQLGTVACGGINRDALAKILKLKNARAILAHPVGMIAK